MGKVLNAKDYWGKQNQALRLRIDSSFQRQRGAGKIEGLQAYVKFEIN